MSKSIYAFNGVALTPIQINNQVYFSSKSIAQALGYKARNAVTDIYNKNKDEFTQCMTQVVENTDSRFSANLLTRQRVFSLRGAHLIAMFSRTPVAKELLYKNNTLTTSVTAAIFLLSDSNPLLKTKSGTAPVSHADFFMSPIYVGRRVGHSRKVKPRAVPLTFLQASTGFEAPDTQLKPGFHNINQKGDII